MSDDRSLATQAGHLEVGARLKEQPAPELVNTAFAHEVSDGAILYRGMSLADLAYCVSLSESGLIPETAQGPLLRGLLQLHAIAPEAFEFDPIYGDVYTNREQALRKITPPEANADGWLRTGRARRESSTVGYLLTARRRLLMFAEAVADLIQVLLKVCSAHQATLMPDYTYLQKAHPTSLGHYLLTFVMPMLRDLERLQALYSRVNRSPAGGGSVNGARLPIDRERIAALLGFDGVAAHTRDAMWQADVAIEAASCVVMPLTTLDRLAEDMYIFATEEFGYLTLSDAHSRTSVIMPQKKNPYSLAWIRGAARQATGILQTVIATNLTPSGQPDNRIFAYGDVPRLLDLGERAARLMQSVLDRAEWNTDQMARRAGEGFSGATDLGDYLSESAGLDPRTAHRLIGWAVREAQQAGTPSSQPITAAALDRASQAILQRALVLDEAEVAAAQHPARIVESRRGIGGAGSDSVAAMVQSAREVLQEARYWLDGAVTRIHAAESAVVALAEGMARR